MYIWASTEKKDIRLGFKYSCAHHIFYLKGCGTVLKEDPPAAAGETLPIVAAKLETTGQWGTVPACTPHYRTAQNEQVVANTQSTTYLGSVYIPVREEKAYVHLKFNVAKSYKQKAFPLDTQQYGNLEDLPSLQHWQCHYSQVLQRQSQQI